MPGILYVVATPIGNLSDATARCIDTLREAQVVACEDTRVTRTLLARYGIATPLVSLHEHNERQSAAKLLERMNAGESVALVSDAGTPGLSDPGAILVEHAHRARVRVCPIPGANAAAAALSASGFAARQFFFAGFLPAAGGARRKALEGIDGPWPVVLYEAPHRVRRTLTDLVDRLGGDREVLVARELTKKFEELRRLPLGKAVHWIDEAVHREQGEFVLVLSPGSAAPVPAACDPVTVLEALLEKLPPSDAAKLAARISGAPRNELYKQALARVKPLAK